MSDNICTSSADRQTLICQKLLLWTQDLKREPLKAKRVVPLNSLNQHFEDQCNVSLIYTAVYLHELIIICMLYVSDKRKGQCSSETYSE